MLSKTCKHHNAKNRNHDDNANSTSNANNADSVNNAENADNANDAENVVNVNYVASCHVERWQLPLLKNRSPQRDSMDFKSVKIDEPMENETINMHNPQTERIEHCDQEIEHVEEDPAPIATIAPVETNLSVLKAKNSRLRHLLSKPRSFYDSSENDTTPSSPSNPSPTSSQSTSQLKRTYKKALTDYFAACQRLQSQTSHCFKHSTELQSRLRNKEDNAEKLNKTLQTYIRDIAQQSSFANGKSFDMELFEELTNGTIRSLGDDLERARLRNTTMKVNLSQLEQKIQKKNELAGGVSHIEFHQLEGEIGRLDEKITNYREDIKRVKLEDNNLRQFEIKLQTSIENCEKNYLSITDRTKEMDGMIDKKRSKLAKLEQTIKNSQKEIGYNEVDIGMYLKLPEVNRDFMYSKTDVKGLYLRIEELELQLANLTSQSY